MMLNVQALKEACKTLKVEHEKAAEDKYQTEVKAYQDALKKWLQSDNPAKIKAELSKISAKLRKGLPVTSSDIYPLNGGYRSEIETFSHKVPVKKAAHTDTLDALLAFLDTVPEETISSSGLRDVGFRNLGTLFTKARS